MQVTVRGRLNENGESLLIRSDSRVTNLQELGEIIVSNHQGTLVQVKDIADVHTRCPYPLRSSNRKWSG